MTFIPRGLGYLGLGLLVASCSPDLLFKAPDVASVAVSPTSTTLVPGATQTLAASLRNARNELLADREVLWSSSNTSVATVSGAGLVTARAVGTATITARSQGQSATAAIAVVAATDCNTNNPPADTQLLCTNINYSVPSTSGGTTRSYRLSRSTIANFSVLLSGGSGDADLYVRTPTGSQACSSTGSTNAETCDLLGVAGTWTIEVRAFSSFSGLSLRIQ